MCSHRSHNATILLTLGAMAIVFFFQSSISVCQEFQLHTFARHQLSDAYYSEGIGTGDLDRDGNMDIVYGPLWFAGPAYEKQYEIYPPIAQPRERYADHFFSWVYDFNRDGWNDILVAGFPGTPGFVYENPGKDKHNQHWPKHKVLSAVSNESPHFTNLVGDERPEIVCTLGGYFGYAQIDAEHPFGPWKFLHISDKIAPVPFGHGLGVGDINGDKRLDVLMKDGWFEQPEQVEQANQWPFHPFKFTPVGGSEMYAYDCDGDGDNDVITSITAHDFGLAWFEQIQQDGKPSFRKHLIMGDKPSENRYGLLFSELHSVNLSDIDGDGLKDIVTGKTYWSHHTKSPMWDAGAVVVWFRLVRGKEGVDWVPYTADKESGIGRQLVVTDINRDGLPEILAGGMKGAHWLKHERKACDEPQWKAAQPKPLAAQ